MHQEADVAVFGAGPVGCATALAFARQGARVALVEPSVERKARFAGELLHPHGVSLLKSLGIDAVPAVSDHSACRGFAVFSNEADSPIVLDYPTDLGWTFEHSRFVDELRERVAGHALVDLVPGKRLASIDGQVATLAAGKEGGGTIRANLLVGADGRFSTTRNALGLGKDQTQLSHMAGLLLRDIELPCEGYGHVVLGGFGPALVYRISAHEVRVCLDVPLPIKRAANRERLIWEGYKDVLPLALREPIRRELEANRVLWAVNELRPRTTYGRPGAALVGDAAGHTHPMTAIGITMGLMDAEALCRKGDVAGLAAERGRTSQAPELLSTALYEIFALRNEATSACRHAIFRMWRNSRALRRQTMDFLSCSDTSMPRLLAVGLPLATLASGHVAHGAARSREWRHAFGTTRRIAGLLHWLLWESVPESMQFTAMKAAATPFEVLRHREVQQIGENVATAS